MIDDVFDLSGTAQAGFLPVGQHFIKQMCVLRLLRRRIDQTWVGRRILRLKLLDLFKIARIGDNLREFLELLELAQFGFFLFSDSSAHTFSSSVTIERLPLDAQSA